MHSHAPVLALAVRSLILGGLALSVAAPCHEDHTPEDVNQMTMVTSNDEAVAGELDGIAAAVKSRAEEKRSGTREVQDLRANEGREKKERKR